MAADLKEDGSGTGGTPGIEAGQALQAVRRWWWAPLLAMVVAAVGAYYWLSTAPYQTEVRATVLIPGDTEDPGRAERPELMVLDDLPPFVGSYAFAEGVHASLAESDLTVSEVESSLRGSRYSRVLTVTIRSDSREAVEQIGAAVSESLPELINAYLIPEGGMPATVRVIDPPGEPVRTRENALFRVALSVAMAGVAGGFVAVFLGDRRTYRGRSTESRDAVTEPAIVRSTARDTTSFADR
jgi:hypothetical protein